MGCAQLERDTWIELTKIGLAAARSRDPVVGRRRKMTDTKIEAAKSMLPNGTCVIDIASAFGICVPI